ncbi:MAG: AEC family transporter [Methylohalobius sp.]|nr:AEC family transporter [Methylohalobius sp.]
MTQVLIQMFLLILCGSAWRSLRLAGLGGDQIRLVLTHLVYYLFLPGLILKLMGQFELGVETLWIALYGAGMVGFGGMMAGGCLRWCKLASPQAGAVWLAVVFPNVTFLGLPVLQQTFGDWAALLVIQLDLFACTPLVLTWGVGMAQAFGLRHLDNPRWLDLLRVPPLWAMIVGVGLSLFGWKLPSWALSFVELLAGAVTPLILLALGLALDLASLRRGNWLLLGAVAISKLVLMPLFGLGLGKLLDFEGDKLMALVLEAGMPSMLFGIVLCDRFGLDSRLYALLVTGTTLLSLISLPFWYELLQGKV